MQRLALLIATFLGSAAVIFLERGIYFYTKDQFDFSRSANLWLGLIFGLSYVLGALLSHGIAARFGERRVLLATVTGQVLAVLAIVLVPQPLTVWIVFPPYGVFSGGMWPVVESYTTAGLASKKMLKVVGRFCIAWSSAVPIALAISGPLIESRWPVSLFVVGLAFYAVVGAVFLALPAHPTHLAHDDPQRPDPLRLERYQKLITSSRWSMLAAYALLFLLAPLMPQILEDKLKLSTAVATPIASIIDWARLAAFLLLMFVTAWYGRALPLLAAVVLMPIGFLLVLFGTSVSVVIAGEVVFGLVSGLVYYAALYYALATKNAAVEAGGAHEALIGAGFALGPMCGLVGLGMADVTGSYVQGMMIGVGPMVLACAALAVRPLARLRVKTV